MISSSANAQIKHLEKLMKSSRERAKEGLYVCEGIKMFLEVLEQPDALVKAYVSESFLRQEVFQKKIQGRLTVPWETVSDSVFDRAADTVTPQGILGLVRQPEYDLKRILAAGDRNLLMLEDLRDPGNLGTIVRTAEAAGIGGIILSKGSADIFSPKVIRATMGAIYRIPFVYAGDFQEVLSMLAGKGITVYAAHLAGSIWYDEADYTKRCAILIGNEANGLSEASASLAGCRIRIPMEGRTESLNAAVAAAVLMYEAFRQRRKGPVGES